MGGHINVVATSKRTCRVPVEQDWVQCPRERQRYTHKSSSSVDVGIQSSETLSNGRRESSRD